MGFFYVLSYLYIMKVIITEEQKKKLFIPRKIDERDRQYLSEIGMNPVIQYIKDNGTAIQFDISTTPDEWDWIIHGIFDTNDFSKVMEVKYENPIKKLILDIADNIDGVYHIWGNISINEKNKLFISYDYEISQLKSGDKTYQL